MNILLYNPRSSKTRKPVLPMSLLAIGAILEGQQDYRIIDGNLEDDPYITLSTAIGDTASTTVVAITVMPGPQLEDATPLSRRLKADFPELTIVWGGYFPSQHWQNCVRDGGVDFVVRKHGEQAFAELIEQLRSGLCDFEKIRGLAWLQDGEPRSIPAPKTPDPGKLPEWNFDKVDIGNYLRSTFLGQRTLGLHTSYGCPYFCNFCAVVNMVEGRWLAWPPERVERIVRSYRDRWAVNAVEFYDNNFFVSENRVKECADRLRPLNIAWWGEGRIDTMARFSDATWRAMAESGLKMVFLGAESGSQDTLDRMSKGGSVSPETTLEIVKHMKHWGIIPELSFVLGNPPDAESDALQTIEFIRTIKSINSATEIILYLYTPVPSSGELFEQARASGFAFPESLDEWISGEWLEFAQRRAELPWLKPALVTNIKNFERVLNAYYPTTTLTNLEGWQRKLLHSLSAWRYHRRMYHAPLELRLFHRLFAYQRPETSGF